MIACGVSCPFRRLTQKHTGFGEGEWQVETHWKQT